MSQKIYVDYRTVKILDQQLRLRIPAQIARELNIEPKQKLIVETDLANNRIIITKMPV